MFISVAMLAAAATPALAADVYSWSQNVAVAPFSDSRQQGETALVSDAQGRVWLSFIDAAYQKVATGNWIAWPRDVRLFMSTDAGKSFTAQPSLSGDSAGDEALAAAATGPVYASFVHYQANPFRQSIALKRLDTAHDLNVACLPYDERTRHDQANVHVGKRNVVHVVGVDIHTPPNPGGALLYARSVDEGATCGQQRRFAPIGQLPQVVDTERALVIAGPAGYYTSTDGGTIFSEKTSRTFGDKLARAAVSPDRRVIYVVGDGTVGGLRLHASSDGGLSWRVARVHDGARATAWRYPAVHVDGGGRVHVVWMDDRSASGAVYHAYSDDTGAHFSLNTRVSDRPFRFPANAPPPPPGTQDGSWVGDYLSVTSAGDRVIVAWSDQRAGAPKSVVQVAVGTHR